MYVGKARHALISSFLALHAFVVNRGKFVFTAPTCVRV